MTIVPYLPQWMRGKRQKPTPRRLKTVSKKGPTSPADAAEAEPLNDLFPRQQSGGIPGSVAVVIRRPVAQKQSTRLISERTWSVTARDDRFQSNERTKTMKLAKALKLKNQLAGEVAQLKDLLAKQNVRSTKQKFDSQNREILAQLRAKIDELAKVKAALGAANAEVYKKIFRLAELKGLVTVLSGLETKTGVFHEGVQFGQPSYEVEYVAQLSKVDIDKLVAELKEEIQALQDELDEFNFTRTLSLT